MALTKIDDRGLTTPIDLLDNEKIRFGTGNDLEFFHDGSHSRIHNSTGNISCKSSGYQFNNVLGTENCLDIIQNGEVKLYYDGGTDPKLETQGHGVNINDGELRIGDASGGNDALIRLGATGTDVDTHGVIYYDKSDNYLSLVVAGESHGSGGVLIDSNGEVLIGATARGREKGLHLAGANQDPTGVWTQMGIYSTDSQAANKGGSIGFGGQDGSTAKQQFSAIKGAKENATSGNYAGYMAFYTRPAADTTKERLRIKSGGQVCIGTTDGPGEVGLYLGDGTNPAGHLYANGSDHLYVLANAYYNGGWKYQGSGIPGNLTIGDGDFAYSTAPTGSAGNAITWAEVFRAKNSNGDFEISNGNLVVADGKGINFGAQTPSSVTGATNVAETLDHYEEGTWTPTFAGSSTTGSVTVTAAHCQYTRIGELVNVTFDIAWDNFTGTGHLQIGGLPWTPKANCNVAGPVMTQNLNTPTMTNEVTSLVAHTWGSVSYFRLYVSQDNGGVTAVQCDDNAVVTGNLTYMAA